MSSRVKPNLHMHTRTGMFLLGLHVAAGERNGANTKRKHGPMTAAPAPMATDSDWGLALAFRFVLFNCMTANMGQGMRR